MNPPVDFFSKGIYILCVFSIWAAYFTIVVIVFKHLPRKQSSIIDRLYLFLIALFLLGCTAHLLASYSLWQLHYRFSTIVLLFAAMVSWIIVFSISRLLPPAYLYISGQAMKEAGDRYEKIKEDGWENDIQLQTIYENAPDAVIIITSKGNIVKWNPAAEKMLGWKEEEVIGKVLNDLIVPEQNRQVHIDEMKNFLKTGKSLVLNRPTMQTVIAKDKSVLKVEFTVSPVQIKDDFLFIGFVRDATEIRKAAEALKLSEERWRLLTSEVHDYSIIMLTPGGNISSWNEGAQRIKGYTENEIVGKHISVFYPKESVDRNFPMEELEIAKKEGRYEDEGWRVKKDGSLFWANVVITSLKFQGELIGFSKITRDMTEWKKSEVKIKEMNASLEQRVKERTEELALSEKKYRKLFENCPMPMWVIELPSLKFIDVNEAAITHYGYSRGEFLSMTTLDIRPDDEKERFLQLDNSGSIGMRSTSTWKHLKKDGSIILVEVSSHEMNIDNKKARMVLSIDITDRKKAEERLDFALEAGQIGIWEHNIINDISVRNLRHDQIFGYEEEITDWNMKKFLSLIHPEDINQLTVSYEEALSTHSWVAETRILWPDSSVHWVLIKGKVILNSKNRPFKMLGTIIDITKVKQVEEEIRQLNNELEERVQLRTEELQAVNQELESFSYSVSHDLRAPLRAIHSYSQILMQDYSKDLVEDGTRILNKIMFNAQRMRSLIDDLLEFSRLGKMTLHKTSVDVNKVVNDIIGELTHSNKYHQHIKVGELGTAFGDEGMVQLVFQNLLLNATKYSSRKENPLVEVGRTETEKGNTYFVKDNGAGFDMTYYDKLFGVFQRLHRQEEFEGIGVGLAIVQKIISRHGGQIWATSILNEGATFFFTLNNNGAG